MVQGFRGSNVWGRKVMVWGSEQIYTHTHTHTHTNREREREREREGYGYLGRPGILVLLVFLAV
jgi:hypothetical protein